MNVAVNPGSSTAVTPVGGSETKYQKFIRLAEARVTRALEDFRLINQLSARTYEHRPSEAETIIKTLANAISETARTFGVPFAFRVGKASKAEADAGNSIFDEPKTKTLQETSKVKLGIARALDHIKQNDIEGAKTILVDLL